MFGKTVLMSSLLALGVATGAVAQSGPRLVGGGDNAQVVYGDGPMGSVVGGGSVAVIGGGDDRAYSYGAVNALPGRDARLVGGGVNAEVVYGAPQNTGGVADRAAPGFRG